MRAGGRRLFAAVPAGADGIMMKHIIHDRDDEHSRKILKACDAALPSGGRLLVIEAVILPGNEPSLGKMLDIEMLLIGGRERADAEFRKLYEDTGFELIRIVATPSSVSVVEGRRTADSLSSRAFENNESSGVSTEPTSLPAR